MGFKPSYVELAKDAAKRGGPLTLRCCYLGQGVLMGGTIARTMRCVVCHGAPSFPVRGAHDGGGTARLADCCFALLRANDEGGTKRLEGVSAEDLGHVPPRAILTTPGELLVGAHHDAVRRPLAAEVVELAPLSVDFLKQCLR